MSDHRSIRIVGAVILVMGVGATGYAIGWEQGDSLASSQAHYDVATAKMLNRKTMAEIGVCRWAEIEANCGFIPFPRSP